MQVSYRIFEYLTADKGIHDQNVYTKLQLFCRYGGKIVTLLHPFDHALYNPEEQFVIINPGFVSHIIAFDRGEYR
jgi:hypothetical protein